MTFPCNKKVIKLKLKDYILRIYHFLADTTFTMLPENQKVAGSNAIKKLVGLKYLNSLRWTRHPQGQEKQEKNAEIYKGSAKLFSRQLNMGIQLVSKKNATHIWF